MVAGRGEEPPEMIVCERKPMAEILGFVERHGRILVAGCSECVTVCQAGGEREVETLASALRLYFSTKGRSVTVRTAVLTRQCDPEFLEECADAVSEVDAVISLGCGVGVQFMAERFGEVPVYPGVNTKFAGGSVAPGTWAERCGLCGDCILYLTCGICPVARCSKGLLNGPCGGSQGGKCEVSPDIDCAWHLIYERARKLGRLDMLLEYQPPKDWSRSRDGGPRKVVREDVAL